MLRAGFRCRVIVKHGALTAGFQLGQFFEAGGQPRWIDASFTQQVVRVVVRFRLLALGELRVHQFFAEIAQLRLRQATDDTTSGGRRRAHGVGAQRDLHAFLHVAQRNVAHFVADNRFHFIIVHQVHQAAINADAAVGHREGVDVFCFINLIVDRLTVDVIAQRRGNLAQAFAVLAAGRRNSGFGVHLFTRLVT